MKYALWIVQGLLALGFVMGGGMKLAMPVEALAPNMPWVTEFPAFAIKLIGLLEVAGGIGVILPMLLKKFEFLTPLAAIGLALTMVGAIITHLVYGGDMPPAIMMLAMSAFVAYGRKDLLAGMSA